MFEKLKIKLTKKQLRIVLGMIMMDMFIAIAFQINFFLTAVFKANYQSGWWIAFLLMLVLFWYLWLPTIICIIIIYLLLTRVYKYEEVQEK